MTEGNKRVEKAELTGSAITNTIKSLEMDIRDTNYLINIINQFIQEIESGKNLKGNSYNKVKEKLVKYSEVLEIRKTTADTLKNAINNAVNQMIAYIGDDDDGVLDQTFKEEAEQKKISSLQHIENIKNKMKGLTEEFEEQKLKSIIAQENATIEDLNLLIKKLEGLTDADNRAFSVLESAMSDISKYNSKVNDIQESKISISL